MQAHDLIRAVGEALIAAVAGGLGGGDDAREQAEFRDLPRWLAHYFDQRESTAARQNPRHAAFRVRGKGGFIEISDPQRKFAITLAFETAGPAAK